LGGGGFNLLENGRWGTNCPVGEIERPLLYDSHADPSLALRDLVTTEASLLIQL